MSISHTPIITLALTLGCTSQPPEAPSLSSTADAQPHIAVLPDPAAEIVESSQTVPFDGQLPRTADGGPLPGDGSFSCASEIQWLGGRERQTIIIEADRAAEGLQIHMARTSAHDRDEDPEVESSELLTEFTWNADAIRLHMGTEVTIVEIESVPGTSSRLFTGHGSTSSCMMVGFTCWDETLEPRFTYDAETGECTDATGVQGLNPWPIEMIRETGDGECADLRGVELEERDYNHPQLTDWNLRGANLDGASISFAMLSNAALQGADLSGLQMAYAHLEGNIDGFTQLPNAHCYVFLDSSLFCAL
jgi:hypothetical protein